MPALGPESTSQVPPRRWTIDPGQSRVGFSVRHLMVATVRGVFTRFEGGLETGAAGLARTSGVVDTASLDTGEPKRDERLRGPEFFDAERNPEIRFASRRIERDGGGTLRVVGDLTIGGVTRELTLRALVREHSAGVDRLQVEARGEISRSELGLAWKDTLEAAGALVGDRVQVALDIVAVPATDGSRADP